MKKIILFSICLFSCHLIFGQDLIQDQKKKKAAIEKRISGTFEINWVSYMMYESDFLDNDVVLQPFSGLEPAFYLNVHTTYNSWVSIGAKPNGFYNYITSEEDVFFITSVSVPVLFNFTFDSYDYTKLASQQSPYDGFGISAGGYFGAWNRWNYRNVDLELETSKFESKNVGGIVEIFFGSKDFMLKISAMKDITPLVFEQNDVVKRFYLGLTSSYMF